MTLAAHMLPVAAAPTEKRYEFSPLHPACVAL